MPDKKSLEDALNYAAMHFMFNGILEELHKDKSNFNYFNIKDCSDLAAIYFSKLSEQDKDETHTRIFFGDNDTKKALVDINNGVYSKQKIDALIKHYKAANESALKHMNARAHLAIIR